MPNVQDTVDTSARESETEISLPLMLILALLTPSALVLMGYLGMVTLPALAILMGSCAFTWFATSTSSDSNRDFGDNS